MSTDDLAERWDELSTHERVHWIAQYLDARSTSDLTGPEIALIKHETERIVEEVRTIIEAIAPAMLELVRGVAECYDRPDSDPR